MRSALFHRTMHPICVHVAETMVSPPSGERYAATFCPSCSMTLPCPGFTARVDLRWAGAHGLRGDRLDGTLTLEGPPAAHLGTGAITGLARLPEGGARLSASGPPAGTRLH